ncbi:POTRA domain-containing protein [uncultured Pantoea sp.]|uniref:ShlB/FhaC/HecB family hemolysin secretion/activation protein n=1 Tax=uncultured Pantoea sp. TaxID=218084 RepID=UPI00258AD9F5|nr:POTRA domain-containing protein [uncultured Pantoea sp.]
MQKTGPAPASGPCFNIHQISLQQMTLITPVKQAKLTAPYINQCLSLERINQLVRDISEWYVQRGYITSRAFLTEQNLSRGVLIITVLEGRLEEIRLQGARSRQLRMAFPTKAGRILNLRDIEQGMEQINRLRTTPVQIEILPSTKPGYSIVNLTSKPEFPLTLGLNMDNSGQRSTGVGQVSASLVGNDLLGLADLKLEPILIQRTNLAILPLQAGRYKNIAAAKEVSILPLKELLLRSMDRGRKY